MNESPSLNWKKYIYINNGLFTHMVYFTNNIYLFFPSLIFIWHTFYEKLPSPHTNSVLPFTLHRYNPKLCLWKY
jgi:hypothetical protein